MLFRKLTLSVALAAFTVLPTLAEAGYIIWPCSGRVSSAYGPRSSPCSGCSTFHHGIDIAVGSGTNLGAPANGTVASYVWSSCGGNIYTISYGGGWQTRFLHCSASVVGPGNSVSKNTTCARSGNTGSCTTGAHLHFEVRKDGVSQSIPGSVNTNVTRNTNVPKDYAGLNDSASVTVIVDNTSGGFSASSGWATSSSASDKYGTNYRYKSTAPISDTAKWTANLSSGTYNVSAWWSQGTNRSPAAPYILPNGNSVTRNQQANGGKWNSLGSLSLSGSVTTQLSCWASTGYVVIADAIRYQK